MFIGRLTKEPSDIRIFGRAIAMRHVPGKHDATPEDILLRDWKPKWPHYIRVHHAEFLNGTMKDGVSLNALMDDLKASAFEATKRNAARGEGNTNPHAAYNQQAAVRLSTEGATWINERLEVAFARCGRVPQAQMDELDWPEGSKIWRATST